MDISAYAESDYLTVQNIIDSKSKKLVIISPAIEETLNGKTFIKFRVEIDGKKKLWKPNRTTLQGLIVKFGKDDANFVGKVINLSVQSRSAPIRNTSDIIIGSA